MKKIMNTGLLMLSFLSLNLFAQVDIQKIYPATVKKAIMEWPNTTKQAAMQLMSKHGAPDQISQGQLVWLNIQPFKRTILHRVPVKHLFPTLHYDFLEQVIDYTVPLDRYDDMARFDGSILLNRTSGEMAAKCHMQAANFLALNLAHKVATGVFTVKEARQAYTDAIISHKKGRTPDSMKKLLFAQPAKSTADPDFSTIR